MLRLRPGGIFRDTRGSGDGSGEPASHGLRVRFASLLGGFRRGPARGITIDGAQSRKVLQQFELGSGRAAGRIGQSPGWRSAASPGHGIAQVLTWRLAAAGAAVLAVIALPNAASAQVQYSPVCGVTGYATAPTTITYDPFSPGGLSQATIPLILQRNRTTQGGRTSEVSLVLVAPAGTPSLQVTYQGQNVLYQEGSTAGRPRALNSKDGGAGAAGEIRYTFGGSSATDLSTALNLRVTVPAGTDLSAGEPIYFDILYICSGAGGMQSVSSPTRESRAVRINVNTVSALQAYYAGSTLDFGEIGDVTTAQVLANPTAFTTSATNSLRVRSSGPFEVRLRSDNDFRLTFPGGNLTSSSDTIRYSVRFLGVDTASNATFGTKTCTRAGVAGTSGVLPIRAKLTEGGAGKTPSSNYADTVTITFTPIIMASGAQSCAGL
ncbi:hypothetical protein [Altererythrobacter sp. Root672]|uniref:hypothetical protein n=1 Tax=Altererythrobacter sp. Root672 TaxID=1736584 RepID=UPI0006FB58CA|nr:hypothetical protein [Altererythrobacter sp. Root672]KRA82695.1 hypothetical protein ASD76_00940 [Altererythrobacter sp. Root672]